jgi:hypothetical protein
LKRWRKKNREKPRDAAKGKGIEGQNVEALDEGIKGQLEEEGYWVSEVPIKRLSEEDKGEAARGRETEGESAQEREVRSSKRKKKEDRMKEWEEK